MLLEAKILDPVYIRLGKKTNIAIIGEDGEKFPLNPGVVLSGNHYGFVIIVDHNGKQKEYVYPTQCNIGGIGFEGKNLKIFEDGKVLPWIFDKLGNLEHSTFNDFSSEFIYEYNIIETDSSFTGEPILKNPVSIKIAEDPKKSVILRDDNIEEDYPIYPGAVLGSVHYGFILIMDTEKGQREIIYPTQNSIYGVGIEGTPNDDLKIFEKDKYHPWVFSLDGKLVNESSYNPFSLRDKAMKKKCDDIALVKKR